MNEYKLNKLLKEDKHLSFIRAIIKGLKQNPGRPNEARKSKDTP